MSRTYRMIADDRPIMQITELFPAAVGKGDTGRSGVADKGSHSVDAHPTHGQRIA